MINEIRPQSYDLQIHITRFFVEMMKGNYPYAKQVLQNNLPKNPSLNEPMVLLSNSLVAYNERGPKDALFYLKKIAERNPLKTPPEIWLAIGICYFKSRNLPKAKFSLEHVLSLQPHNSMALTALGIVELQINFSDRNQRSKAVELFKQSFEVDDTNPLTMKHLAEHFFNCGELKVAEQLAKRAVKFCERIIKPLTGETIQKREMSMLLSDLLFIQGKIAHSNRDFDAAFKHYHHSSSLNKMNPSAIFNLSKLYLYKG